VTIHGSTGLPAFSDLLDASLVEHEYQGGEECQGCPFAVFQSQPYRLRIS